MAHGIASPSAAKPCPGNTDGVVASGHRRIDETSVCRGRQPICGRRSAQSPVAPDKLLLRTIACRAARVVQAVGCPGWVIHDQVAPIAAWPKSVMPPKAEVDPALAARRSHTQWHLLGPKFRCAMQGSEYGQGVPSDAGYHQSEIWKRRSKDRGRLHGLLERAEVGLAPAQRGLPFDFANQAGIVASRLPCRQGRQRRGHSERLPKYRRRSVWPLHGWPRAGTV